MAKRKVQFNDVIDTVEINNEELNEDLNEELNEENNEENNELKVKFGKKFKHTLDSDEEDDELIQQNYNVLDSDQIDGQEDATIDHEGDVQITPFNMKEELETGHFDKEGNYIFDKTEEIRDNWLDHIDWIRIKDKTTSEIKEDKQTNDESDDESDQKSKIDLTDVYKQLIELMEPKESVQKAIQRLGKSSGKMKSSERWKKYKEIELTEEQKQSKEKLIKLSSLADQVLQTGDMNVYEKTFEQLVFTLKKSSKVNSIESDMFSDDFDSTKKANSEPNDSLSDNSNNEIKWEFKWEDKDSAPVFGPHTSIEMLGWVNDGYFKDGVYVRQINKSDSQFYTSKRIDFDLFT